MTFEIEHGWFSMLVTGFPSRLGQDILLEIPREVSRNPFLW